MRSVLIGDSQLKNILLKEFRRQKRGIELIASENFTSQNVLDCLGSVFTNKYSEGLPGKRYYGGNQYIDELETLCQERALKTYRLNPANWGINVQPYSGSVANVAAYFGILKPHDRIMGLDLPSGGHLSHGFYTPKKKISTTSIIFESLPYKINETGYIDYDKLEEYALVFQPRLIICGGSAYPRDLDYKRFREIANKVNAYLMCDMAHISGFVATQEMNDPFPYCDLVTTTTHKTLRGPRSGLIFYKKEFKDTINDSVFPGLQGGPHQNKIAGVCTQLLEASTPEFKEYIQQVKKNAQSLSSMLQNLGYKISTNGTENHIVLCVVRDKGVTGSKVELVCEHADISINKNTVYGDTSPMNPGGIRLGTSAMTTRKLKEEDFKKIAIFIDRAVKIAIDIQNKNGKKLVDFKKEIESNNDIISLKKEVNDFSENLYFPTNMDEFI